MSHSGTELRRRGEGWLKAGTRLNGNWGIPERRAKTGALVSTESSSAERANTVGRGVVGGERRFKGGRTLPGNPSLLAASPLDPPPPPATMPRYQYRLCRRFHLLYQRGPRFSTLPRLLCPSTPLPSPVLRSLFSSALLRTLNAASSIIQAPDAQPLSFFVGFSVSTCLGSCFFFFSFFFFFFFSIFPRGGGEGDLGRVTDACEGEFRSDSGKSQSVNWK